MLASSHLAGTSSRPCDRPANGASSPVIRLRHIAVAALALVALLGLPAATAVASSDDVIEDCSQDGRLDRNYSRGELEDARDDIPTDVDEYTDCRAVIDARLNSMRRGGRGGGAGGGGAGGSGGGIDGSGGGITATDPSLITDSGAVAAAQGDIDALEDARQRDYANETGPEIDVAGKPVTAGPNGVVDVATAANEVPPPLIAALVAVAALSLGAGALLLRRRWPQTRRAALRLLRR